MKNTILYLFVSFISCTACASQQSTARSTTRAQHRLTKNETVQESARTIYQAMLADEARTPQKKQVDEMDMGKELLILDAWRLRVHLFEEREAIRNRAAKTNTTLCKDSE